MTSAGRVPPGLDVTRPNVARVYDAFLDGKDNFAAARQVVEFALQVTPDAPSSSPGPARAADDPARPGGARAHRLNEKLGTGRWRSQEEILAWFGDWELLEPGLVPLPEWRPVVQGRASRDATYYGFAGGVARKPL